MTVIGITGPTGAGKTTALDVLAELGFEIVDCDALYYQLLRTDEALRRSLEEAFGPVFLPDGSLDRRAVAKRVFGDRRSWRSSTASCFPPYPGRWSRKSENVHKKDLLLMPSIW